MTDLFVTEEKLQAQQAAYAAVAKLKPEPTSVVEYQSPGHVIVIISSDKQSELGELPEPLSFETIQFAGRAANKDISINGALGQFEVGIAGNEIQHKADLILDLSSQPILTMALKPPGYIHAGLEPADLENAKKELVELVGTFEKPRYFNYDENLCAHSRSGITGCTRCIEACPAEAITSLVDKISVDPFRCQGGGICTTVCPSSALTYAYPKPRDLLTHVRTLIVSYLNDLGTDQSTQASVGPDLVFVTEDEQQRAEHLMPAALVITVEEVASVGTEVWLSALAWGARSVRLFDLDSMPEKALTALQLHLQVVEKILSALSFPAQSVALISDESELITTTSLPQITRSNHAPLAEKRQAYYLALDHLVAEGEKLAEKIKTEVTLPLGAVFGEATIDKSTCTLCMSCVSACPGNALQDGSELPQVSLVEANCLQCGICVSTCPEDAISITPRLLLDRESRQKARVLHEDEPFCCTKCGKPFATKSGIATILTKLAGHYMFEDERSRDRLKMCDDCRVVDMMEDPNTDF